MDKQIKIGTSPITQTMETVGGDILIILHAPYSDKEVTVLLNPGIQEYVGNQDQPGMKVRDLTVSAPTNETQTLRFDFGKNNVHEVEINGKNYEIKLMNIGKENVEGQDFPYFEFFVKESN